MAYDIREGEIYKLLYIIQTGRLKPEHASENGHVHSLPYIECLLIFMTS